MTATLIAFPAPQERDNMEFDRTGENRFTRAGEVACSLWEAVNAGRKDEDLTARIDALGREVEHMARYRADSLEDLILLNGGGRIALAIMPDMLRAMIGTTPASRSPIVDAGR